jgi:predicted ATPase
VDAIALFCARARARDPGFDLDDANAPAIAEICRRVDGLPLAIELAAARCGLLSPDEIAQRLDDALGAMGTGARDAPARQRTLRATIDWSHELLSDAEKECFARFAVFSGGATVQAAETITHAELDTLDSLVAKSLLVLRQDRQAGSRLGMLETVRAYAAERFASASDVDSVREDHFRYYLALAQHHGTQQALWGARRNEHLAQLDAEADNLDGALRWACAQPRRPGVGGGGRDHCVLADPQPLCGRRPLDRPSARRSGRRGLSGASRAPSLRQGHLSAALGTRGRATRGLGGG